MQESLALIHIALALNSFDNPLLSEKSLYFAESGNFQGIGNYLQRHWFSLGLDVFEEGIFFKKQQVFDPWIEVKFSRYLWKADQPTPAQLKEYFDSYSLHTGYLPHGPEQRQCFIELICRIHIHDERSIDIILPRLKDLEKQKFEKSWMVSLGISQVLAVECSGEYKEFILGEVELPNQKRLRLIHALPLGPSDFIKLMHLSGEIVGCTGDGSLSDCMTANKIPFYEIRKHKFQVVSAFRHLARFLTLPDVLDYFEQLELFANWPSESYVDKFEQILNQGSFKMQWKELVEFIRRHYCFRGFFYLPCESPFVYHFV